MKSPPVELLGVQAPPRVLYAPTKSAANSWEDVVDLLAAFGVDLDQWQETVLEAGLHERSNGNWVTQQVAVSAPRQNGKSHLIIARALAGVLLFGEKTIIASAHQQDTNRETFGKFTELIDQNPALEKRIKSVMNAINRESITFTNGAQIKFKARSGPGGRGFSADCLLLDEAQILSERAFASIFSTMSARPNPQIWLFGTPPTPEDEGEQFGRIRRRGIEGKTPKLAYLEWSADPNDDFDSPETWAKANPAFGSRLNRDVIEGERGSYDDAQFGRERLGIWDDDLGVGGAIAKAEWDELRVEPEDVPADGRKVFAVRFAVDGSGVGLAAAIRPEDEGPIHVEAIRYAPMNHGTAWLIDWLLERKDEAAQIVVEGKSGVGYLVQSLRDAKVSARVIITPTSDDAQAAHSMMESMISARELTHLGQPELDEQVSIASKRKIGPNGGFGWQAPEGRSVALLDAATLALWGAKTTKRKPGRKGRVL